MVSYLERHLAKIRVPTSCDKIYKEECAFSFDTPESPEGLYICLNKFLGLGHDFVAKYSQKTGNCVFLHVVRLKHEVPSPNVGSPEKKITKLAIGIEGGFNPDEPKKYEYEDRNTLVILPEFTEISLSTEGIPEKVINSVNGVLNSDSANKLDEMQALSGTWDGEQRKVSKFSESLLQLANGVLVPPKGWKCELCDKTDNLWMNLTDGRIFCGRKVFDGSGGNNHAVEHYQNSGYPLAVKLGTITPDGKADVYSYEEDDMVEDSKLVKHLAHFGINVALMEKSDKTMTELEIDINKRIGEWATILESGTKLRALFGPGYCGMANLGNSCYLNSVMQVMFSIPEFLKRYFNKAEDIFMLSDDPNHDFNVQMAKLGCALMTSKYSQPCPGGSDAEDQIQSGIKPSLFKYLIGRGHPDFSSQRQQDAQEFLLHLINMMERYSRRDGNPAECFKFNVEDRIQCQASGCVRYTHRTEYHLPLPIPLDKAINNVAVQEYLDYKKLAESKGEPIDPDKFVRPIISLQDCLNTFALSEQINKFHSSAINGMTSASKTTRLATFPDYLIIQLKKFTLSERWEPVKLDVSVQVPDELDLSFLRGKGLQPQEKELPESQGPPPEIHLDPEVISKLAEMGFPIEGCKKAVYNTNNSGVEAAMNWIMEHMADDDFGAPFVPPGVTPRSGGDLTASEEGIAMIMSMGFTREQAARALGATDNNVERAADWIFSHQGELDGMEVDSTVPFKDGPATYKLYGFISHMGTSTMVGHYVCHILKNNEWVLYNDNKVAVSEHPPKDLAYLYFYKRIDCP